MLKLKPASLDWALRHALSRGDTDIFPYAFEFMAIEHDWGDIRGFLSGVDVLRWHARALRRCLSPKRKWGFRVATQLDPLDFLIFAALVYEIGSDLESQRLPSASESEFMVASNRFCPSTEGSMFDASVGYRAFQERSEELAKTPRVTHVVSTDISDFYPRLYHHRVEGALSSATNKNNHVLGLRNLISQWNQTQSYGIPVGPAPSRLIAEITIDDVDKILVAESTIFARYVDDYRLFCTSDVDAYRKLALLADVLYKNHGLTLQQEKTAIDPVEKFLASNSDTPERAALRTSAKVFEKLLAELSITDPYSDIEYDQLNDQSKEYIEELSLPSLLNEQMEREDIDQPTVRFLLARLGQLDTIDAAEMVLNNVDKLFPVFPDVIRYFARLRSLEEEHRHDIGRRLLEHTEQSSVAASAFHRMWLFSLFSQGIEWGNSDQLVSLYGRYEDAFSRRKLTLALSKSDQSFWFRSRKDDVFELGGWMKRAFLAGASCLPVDERKHWYDFLSPRLDELEKSVVAWARAKPFPGQKN
jgi:hypothetical protein